MPRAACRPGQITAEGKTYRIDGGPAIVDFQSFLTNLDTAVGQVVASDAAFRSFANAVLDSATSDADDIAELRKEGDLLHLRYHTVMTPAFPAAAWGPAPLYGGCMLLIRLT